MTEWRTVIGYTRYEASNDGAVRSKGYGGRRGLVLKPMRMGRNLRYPCVSLHEDSTGKHVKRPIHVLVLLAFYGERPKGMVARHIDDDADNNTVENLCWGTPSENIRDQVANGRNSNASKTHCPQGHSYASESLYITPSGKGGRQCSTCRRERGKRHELERTTCKRGHQYPEEIQQRINGNGKRRYCPICLQDRKPRNNSKKGKSAA